MSGWNAETHEGRAELEARGLYVNFQLVVQPLSAGGVTCQSS
jgi:hypothetical protein